MDVEQQSLQYILFAYRQTVKEKEVASVMKSILSARLIRECAPETNIEYNSNTEYIELHASEAEEGKEPEYYCVVSPRENLQSPTSGSCGSNYIT